MESGVTWKFTREHLAEENLDLLEIRNLGDGGFEFESLILEDDLLDSQLGELVILSEDETEELKRWSTEAHF